MTKLGQELVEKLLEIEAISLKPTAPFTWASGIKSPIYCDNRLTMSYPKIRQLIARGLADSIKKEYPDVEVIAGTATAGIPHAAWVADILDLPMVYIRSQAKKHGKGNQIEGRIESGQKMVVIEDLISTGGSVLDATKAAMEEGAVVLGVSAIFSYGLPEGQANFKESDVRLSTLTNYEEMIDKALEIDYINSHDVKLLQSWKKDPTAW